MSAVAADAPTGSMVIELREAQIGGEGSSGENGVAAAHTPAGGKNGGPCDLQGLGDSSSGGCVGTWMRVTGPLSPDSIALSSVVMVLAGTATTTSAGVSEDRGATTGGGWPMPPAPGPAPGGTSGAAAGGSGAGAGLAGFLAFALLMGLATPRAMRRLRLACLPWRTAFFVLIPERPG